MARAETCVSEPFARKFERSAAKSEPGEAPTAPSTSTPIAFGYTTTANQEEETGPSRLPSLQFDERWRICLEGLDANSVFMCGDRLVIATQTHVVAVSRDDGKVLWARPGQASTTLMAGSVLIRLSPDGEVELCNVDDGEPLLQHSHYAHASEARP